MINLSKEVKLSRVSNSVATGATDVTTSVVDMASFGTVQFVAAMGDVATGTTLSLRAQQGDLADGSDAVDVTGAATAAFVTDATTGDSKMIVVEVARPRKRYLRAILTRSGGGGVVDSVVALQGEPHEAPVTQSADVLASAFGLSPA